MSLRNLLARSLRKSKLLRSTSAQCELRSLQSLRALIARSGPLRLSHSLHSLRALIARGGPFIPYAAWILCARCIGSHALRSLHRIAFGAQPLHRLARHLLHLGGCS